MPVMFEADRLRCKAYEKSIIFPGGANKIFPIPGSTPEQMQSVIQTQIRKAEDKAFRLGYARAQMEMRKALGLPS